MYFVRMIAWAFLFLALVGLGAESLYSLELGRYTILTPATVWQAVSPQSKAAFSVNELSTLREILNVLFLDRPIWMMPAIVSTILFLGVRRRRKKWMFRDN